MTGVEIRRTLLIHLINIGVISRKKNSLIFSELGQNFILKISDVFFLLFYCFLLLYFASLLHWQVFFGIKRTLTLMIFLRSVAN